MHAVVINEPGGPEKLIYQEVPMPLVKPGWSLVNIKGFGINHSELFTRRGDSPSVKFPRILGIECVGVIEDTTDPKRLPIGRKVISIMGEMGRAFDGSYAEYVLLPNDQIYPVQTKLDWQTLATIPETYYTAYCSLLNLRLSTEERVLVRGGSSSVGVAFLKLSQALFPGIQIIGTSRHADKKQQLIDLGFDDVILDQKGVLQTNSKFDKVLELIGPATIKDSFKHVHEHGIVCSTGQLGNQWYLKDFDPIVDLAPNTYLTSFDSGNVNEHRLNQMLAVIEKKHIDVRPDKVFRLDQVSQAHQYIEQNHNIGKVIVLEK